jgi:hypothetical protein
MSEKTGMATQGQHCADCPLKPEDVCHLVCSLAYMFKPRKAYVVRAVSKDETLIAAEFLDDLGSVDLIDAIARWAEQGHEIRIKRVANAGLARAGDR